MGKQEDMMAKWLMVQSPLELLFSGQEVEVEVGFGLENSAESYSARPVPLRWPPQAWSISAETMGH